MKKNINKIIVLICAVAAIFCLYKIVSYQMELKAQQDKLKEVQELTTEIPEEEEPEDETIDLSIYNIPEKNIDFADLQTNTNEDIYAWITIPDSNIDYPVLQHPEELDYYLHYNLDGSKGYPGCIYSQNVNAKDFSDFNTVLYGHNMKNGSMFANLHKFEDQEYFDEHPYVYIYTPDGPLVFAVFAAYTSDDIYLMTYDYSTEESRQDYIDMVMSKEGFFREDVEVTPESNILTLSTCIGGKPNNRYLVASVLVADGRDYSEIQEGQ